MTFSTPRVGGALQRATLLLTLLLSVGWSVAAQAATITVDTNNDEQNTDGDCSLREAIAAANTDAVVDGCTAGDGADTIVFGGGVLLPNVTLNQDGFVVTSQISIDGALLLGTITLDGDNRYRIFDVSTSGDLTLSNMTLTRGGRVDRGGAVLVREGARFSASDVSFDDNWAAGDAATDGGGAIYALGPIDRLEDATFSNNRAIGTSGSGGAIFLNGADAMLVNVTFTANRAQRAGGGIENRDGALTMAGVDFSANNAGMNPGNGGAVHLSADGSADITGGMVSENVAREGGGFWNSGETMRVSNTMFTGNIAVGDGSADRIQGGGALFNDGGLLILQNITAIDNHAIGTSGSGGAILNGSGGATWVMTSTVSENVARRAGGGLEDDGGTVVIVMSTFEENRVVAAANPGNGGAVHSGGGTVVVAGGQYHRNVAIEGGAFWTSGALVITGDEAGIPDPMDMDIVIPTVTPAAITRNVARGNDADQGGGGLYATPSGVIQVFEALIESNVANGTSGSGGGIFSAGDLLAQGTSIRRNRANRAGGGIEDAGGTVSLTDVRLDKNWIQDGAPGNGGGLHSGGGDVTITRGIIADNMAVEGGGLWTNGTLTINGGADGDNDDDDDAEDGDRSFFTVLSGNEASGDEAGIGGGGLYVETGGIASVRYTLINGNTANGTAGSGGGVLVADGASATLAFSEVTGNTANRAGAGIELFDDGSTDDETTVSLRQVYVANNVIDEGAPGNGGGLHAGGAGAVDVSMSTFANNGAVEGGGLWINAAGSLTMGNSTVTGNTSDTDGGGIYDNGGASIALSSVTVALNSADNDGGGLFSASTDMFTVQNTIVADNSAGGMGPDCSGTFDSDGYNLIGDVTGCTVNGDDTDTDGQNPMLAPLAANGGFTPTHALMEGSPAIDSGDSAFDVDQRGMTRSMSPDDRGAYETEGGGTSTSTGEEPQAGAFALGTPQPNPSAGRTRVTFSVAEAAPVELALFNVLGQRVLTAFEGPVSATAPQTVDLDVSGLASGVYVLRLMSGGDVETRQVTVVR
ncbi:choice-of-anchor Q domain-containing protein [Rubrivirga sp. SAORIC476]|uniref:choice-of-anchor Q domain-containing protein n=1 Tax=Rubrivirga sp. SAORIC476 TaxID=1961794 RepID=UPI00117B3624|nr:choice-of-anchor Q domain-containing protein [Rubrivirga sp. SAORIC476]